MNLIRKAIIFICLLPCFSCNDNSTYFGTAQYQAYHLINTYVDVDVFELLEASYYGIYINFATDMSNYYYSKEFADVSQKNQSEEQLRTFVKLAGKNNDSYQWTPWYNTFGLSRNHQGYYKGGTLYALAKGITQIELISEADYDEKHPEGVSLMDNIKMGSEVYGNILDRTNISEILSDRYQSKPYPEYTKKELSVIGPELSLQFISQPTLSKKHNFTLTITFDDGEVFTDTVEVNF